MKSRLLATSVLAATFSLMSFDSGDAGAQSAPTASARAPGDSATAPIQIPSAPPDLVVSLDVPAQILQMGQDVIEIGVDNPLTPVRPTPAGTILGGSAVTGVFVLIRFAGLEPLAVLGDSNFICGLSGTSAASCYAGAIPAGGRATIRVSVKQSGNCKLYCGPVYTDVHVDPNNTISERLETNNRAVSVTDVTGCIN